MAGSIYDWSLVPDDNQTADADINWLENQLPSTVNGSARVMMERIAELIGDVGGALVPTGSANALTITANSAFTAYQQGLRVAFKAASTNTGAVTANVNGLGSKAIRKQGASADVALVAGDIVADGIFLLYYSTAASSAAGAWILVNPSPSNFVTLTDTQTLSNKTLSSPVVSGTITETATAGQAIGVNGGPVAGSGGLTVNTLGPSPSTGQAAFISFNRAGAFAANLGIDTDNLLKVGGWSLGANSYRIMHEGLASGTFTGTYTFSGAITSGNTVTAATFFQSSTTNAILGNTGAGSVLLRPNGAGVATGQLQLTSTGAVTINGTLTVTG